MAQASPQTAVVYEQLKRSLRLQLAERLNADADRTLPLPREALSAHLHQLMRSTREEFRPAVIGPQMEAQVITEIINEMAGFGPLESLFEDPEVTEIMVNGPSQIYVERRGRLEQTPVTFASQEELMAFIERLLDRVGASVTKSDPCVDASLPGGARMNVIVPPLVLNGPTLTIRKELRARPMEEIVSLESVNQQATAFLAACVQAKVNLIISGGTSTGKTTLAAALSTFIPQEERIISIENVAELQLPNRAHWIRLVGRTANIEGRGEVPLRTLVRNALRMRPDRIILGEARGGEALDVVQAMHTGHDGVITILHANSPQAALERLETLMLMSGIDLPSASCRTQIASAVDLVVHMVRYADGSRRIASIAQVLDHPGSGFQVEELFAFEIRGFQTDGALTGELQYTGRRPTFLRKFRLHNVPLPPGIVE